MDKTKKIILLFVILSLLCVFVFSFFFSENKIGEENRNGDTLIVDKGDSYEHTNNNKENQNNTEKTTEKSENQGNQKQESTDKNSLPSGFDSNVDYEGSNEEQKEIMVSVRITGLDGILLVNENVSAKENSSAFDVLESVCKNHAMKIKTSGFGKYIYVQSIGNLKEKQHGAKSGWKYNINGNYVSSSSGGYLLKDKDVMEWYYEHD